MPRLEPTEIEFYEGLVHTTAGMIAGFVQEDFEDIEAILRIKVWQALMAYDPARARQPIHRYVFMCVANQKKDLLKRKRRQEVPLAEDYDARVESDEVFAVVEDETPVVPSTLTVWEKRVVTLLYLGFTEHQTAVKLEVSRARVTRTLEGVRVKMADWRPPTRAPVAIAA